jgi:O-antigen/teichoic acid export membrane protein
MVSVIVLARYLEPRGRGEYFIFQAMVSMLTVFGDFGLSQSANVFVGRHADQKVAIHRFLARSSFALWIGMSLLGGVVLWLVGDRLIPNFPAKWEWAAFGILPIMLYSGFWNSMMIGMGHIWLLNGVQLVMSPFQLLLILVFIVGLSGGVGTAVTVYLFTMLLQFVLMVVAANRLGLLARVQAHDDDLSRQMLAFGLRGYPNAIATMLWMRLPVFVLNLFHGSVPVGVFSVAQQLAEKALLPIQAVQDAIYRKMSTLSTGAAIAVMNRYVRVIVSSMIMVMLMGGLLAPWMVRILFGDSYLGSADVFWILLIGGVFVSVAMIVSTYVLGQLERPGLLSMLAGANAVVCALLSVWFIPSSAELGAAAAIACTQIAGAIVVVVLYLRITGTTLKDVLLIHRSDVSLLVTEVIALAYRKNVRV